MADGIKSGTHYFGPCGIFLRRCGQKLLEFESGAKGFGALGGKHDDIDIVHCIDRFKRLCNGLITRQGQGINGRRVQRDNGNFSLFFQLNFVHIDFPLLQTIPDSRNWRTRAAS